jgi:peptidoglycan/xylan/chitin deacetylase (PgdA/CDA1 family)
MRRVAAVAALAALLALAGTARPLVPEAERLTGADLPTKHLVFTFDQGPSTTTAALSAYLKQHGIHATFFIDGRYADKASAIQVLVADGHLVGSRAYTNRDLVTSVPLEDVPAELEATDELIAPYVPWNRKFFRAPFGSWTRSAQFDAGSDADASDPDAVFHALEKTPMNSYVGPIYWNIDADCSGLTAAACSDAYLQRIHSRSNGIVRFDDTEQVEGAIELLVPQLEKETYVFDALDTVPAVTALLSKCDATCGACTGPGPSDCSACPQGARIVDGQCLACTVCQPGNFTAKACAGEVDTLCSPCTVGSYQPAPGAPACLACGDCSDGDPCTTDACHPVTGCTHTKLPNCPVAIDASVPSADAGSRPPQPTGGSKIDDENNIAVSADDDGGCSAGRAHGSRTRHDGSYAIAVALCIAKIAKKRRSLHRRGRNRPLFL